MKNFEYLITGNDVVPQNMIGDIFLGTPCTLDITQVIPIYFSSIFEGHTSNAIFSYI